ncbi:hypothetical protein MMPV_002259 [Pyropia vietnamensis]
MMFSPVWAGRANSSSPTVASGTAGGAAMAATLPPRSAEAAEAAAAAAHSRALWLALSLPRGSAPAEATTRGLAAALAAAAAGIAPPSHPAAETSSLGTPSGAPTSPPPPPLLPPSSLATAALSALPRLVTAALGFGAGAGWLEAGAAAASADRRALVALLAPGGPLHLLCVAADGGGGGVDGPPRVDRGYRVHFPLSNLPPVTRVDVAARVRAAVDGGGGGGGVGGVGVCASVADAYGGPTSLGGVAGSLPSTPSPSMLGAFAVTRLAAPPGVIPPELTLGAEEYLILCLVANVVWVGVAPPPAGGGPPPGATAAGGVGAPPGRVATRSANLPTVRALVVQLLGLWALHFAGAPLGGAAMAAVTAGVPLTAVLRAGPASRRPRHGALFLAAVVDYWLQFSGEAAAVAHAYGGGVPATVSAGGRAAPAGGLLPSLVGGGTAAAAAAAVASAVNATTAGGAPGSSLGGADLWRSAPPRLAAAAALASPVHADGSGVVRETPADAWGAAPSGASPVWTHTAGTVAGALAGGWDGGGGGGSWGGAGNGWGGAGPVGSSGGPDGMPPGLAALHPDVWDVGPTPRPPSSAWVWDALLMVLLVVRLPPQAGDGREREGGRRSDAAAAVTPTGGGGGVEGPPSTPPARPARSGGTATDAATAAAATAAAAAAVASDTSSPRPFVWGARGATIAAVPSVASPPPPPSPVTVVPGAPGGGTAVALSTAFPPRGNLLTPRFLHATPGGGGAAAGGSPFGTSRRGGRPSVGVGAAGTGGGAAAGGSGAGECGFVAAVAALDGGLGGSGLLSPGGVTALASAAATAAAADLSGPFDVELARSSLLLGGGLVPAAVHLALAAHRLTDDITPVVAALRVLALYVAPWAGGVATAAVSALLPRAPAAGSSSRALGPPARSPVRALSGAAALAALAHRSLVGGVAASRPIGSGGAVSPVAAPSLESWPASGLASRVAVYARVVPAAVSVAADAAVGGSIHGGAALALLSAAAAAPLPSPSPLPVAATAPGAAAGGVSGGPGDGDGTAEPPAGALLTDGAPVELLPLVRVELPGRLAALAAQMDDVTAREWRAASSGAGVVGGRVGGGVPAATTLRAAAAAWQRGAVGSVVPTRPAAASTGAGMTRLTVATATRPSPDAPGLSRSERYARRRAVRRGATSGRSALRGLGRRLGVELPPPAGGRPAAAAVAASTSAAAAAALGGSARAAFAAAAAAAGDVALATWRQPRGTTGGDTAAAAPVNGGIRNRAGTPATVGRAGGSTPVAASTPGRAARVGRGGGAGGVEARDVPWLGSVWARPVAAGECGVAVSVLAAAARLVSRFTGREWDAGRALARWDVLLPLLGTVVGVYVVAVVVAALTAA